MSSEQANKCGFKLFGVQIDVDAAGEKSSIRKSKSLGNLQTCNPEITAAVEPSGYLSDGPLHQSSKSNDRKKGRAWTEEEHRSFLVGLEKLGKGDWKGIATQYVPTRNSSQVASHAQKYFIRMAATEKRRRRSSVFDIPLTATDPLVNQQESQGSHPDFSAETSQAANSRAASSINTGEHRGAASERATSAERPPLSPMKRNGAPDFHSMYYAPRVSNLSRGYATHVIRPTVAWVPFLTYPNQQGNVFLPNDHGTLDPHCAKFVPPQRGSSQSTGGGEAPAPNDELNLNIRKLTL